MSDKEMHKNSQTRLGRIGRVRITIACPNCGSLVHIKMLNRISTRIFEQYGQCANVTCGWTGVIASETVRTITMPTVIKGDVPPKMDAKDIENLQADGQLFL